MYKKMIDELKDGSTIPYLGINVFKGSKAENGVELPYDSDSLIVAMNSGRAMAPRLMYEFSRAAMNLEQRKGREYLEAVVNHIYSNPFKPLQVHNILHLLSPKYIVDTNRDTKLQELYSDRAHILIVGIARITAEYDRFEIYEYDGSEYKETKEPNLELPIIFKPMGTLLPKRSLIISDADYVDWLTEAMGGYGIPKFLKDVRRDKKYLFIGNNFSRDTDRMVANEITLELNGGYVVMDREPSKKEAKFLSKHNLEIIEDETISFITKLEEELNM